MNVGFFSHSSILVLSNHHQPLLLIGSGIRGGFTQGDKAAAFATGGRVGLQLRPKARRELLHQCHLAHAHGLLRGQPLLFLRQADVHVRALNQGLPLPTGLQGMQRKRHKNYKKSAQFGPKNNLSSLQ